MPSQSGPTEFTFAGQSPLVLLGKRCHVAINGGIEVLIHKTRSTISCITTDTVSAERVAGNVLREEMHGTVAEHKLGTTCVEAADGQRPTAVATKPS